MDKEEIIKEWVKYAEMDRETVNILIKSHNKPYEIICYHCQQTVEKYLKACLVLYDISIMKSHDLIELNSLCEQKNKEFKTIEKECFDLTDYAVQTRYPFHKFDLTEELTKKAIQDMEKVCKFISDVLKQDEDCDAENKAPSNIVIKDKSDLIKKLEEGIEDIDNGRVCTIDEAFEEIDSTLND